MTIASISAGFIDFVQTLIPVLSTLAIVIFFVGILRYLYASAQGKEAASKEMMVWGLVAIFVIFSLWGILSVIKGIFIPSGY